MNKNNTNTPTAAIFAGLALLILGVGIFIYFSSASEKNLYSYLSLAIALLVSAMSAAYAYLVYSGKIANVEPDYWTLFIMGLIFLPMAFASDTVIFLAISLGFIVIGLMNKKKWKGEVRWSEMSPARRILIIVLVAVLGILVLITFVVLDMSERKKREEWNNKIVLTEQEARSIAERDCIKSGESLSSDSFYNENSRTWWFDANLVSSPANCNPACVVSEASKSAEINWRCTGLIPPSSAAQVAIRELFAQKYPKYAGTVSVTIEKQTENYARGSVIFETGAPGGIFLAAKTNGEWNVVFDGNGQIPCSLSSYGFPGDMLSDCSQE